MKKEYKAPEMDVVEMDYENRLLCESNCPDTTLPDSNPLDPTLPTLLNSPLG